ncbi:MAG: hypothetical protein U5R30_18440 [Deltaproteobacteria bacterium]|nr:hypothetical protein [Deltaproteobacteria bacterium]
MEAAQTKPALIDLETASPVFRNRTTSPTGNGKNEKRKEAASPQVVDTANERTKDKNQITLARGALVNKVNFFNFSNRTILLKFKHTRFDREFTIEIKPPPCQGERLDLPWPQDDRLISKLKAYVFDSILITDGQMLIRAEAETISMNQTGISLRLPETCQLISHRKMRRYPGRDVDVKMVQNGSLFCGRLLDFNAVTLRVEVEADAHQAYEWINPESSVSLILSGECRYVYRASVASFGTVAATSAGIMCWRRSARKFMRYRQKEFRQRPPGHQPVAGYSLHAPVDQKQLSLKVLDLSGSGFSVEEDEINAQLLNGLTIPEVELRFSQNVSVNCKAQVVYRKVCKEGKNGAWIKCGVAILDMDMENNVRLLSLLHQANNRYA